MTHQCGAIILAAGQSRRMGSNKLLALYRGKPLVAHVADAVAAAGLPAIVVLGHAEREVRAALENRPLDFVVAKDHTEGMGRSIAAGIEAVPDSWQAAFVCLGDMPLIAPQLLQQMSTQGSKTIVLAPIFQGRRGNPVLWGRDYFKSLKELRGDEGARSILLRDTLNLNLLQWLDDSITRDFDTSEDIKIWNDAHNISIDSIIK